MKSSKDLRFVIHCGDTSLHFAYGKLYRLSYLEKTFKQALEPFSENFFPGLVLRDGAGNLVKPQLQVVLVPASETKGGNL